MKLGVAHWVMRYNYKLSSVQMLYTLGCCTLARHSGVTSSHI